MKDVVRLLARPLALLACLCVLSACADEEAMVSTQGPLYDSDLSNLSRISQVTP